MTVAIGNVAELKRRNVVELTVDLLQRCADEPLIGRALALAAFAHDGQVRKELRPEADYVDPYVIHPLRCALRAIRLLPADYDEQARHDIVCAALLHDVVEDSPARMLDFYRLSDGSALDVLAERFGPAVADIVDRVSNRPGVSYSEHLIAHVLPHEQARVVKACDLIDNAGSLGHMAPGPRRLRLAGKYRPVVSLLIDQVPAALSERLVTVAELLDQLD